MHRPGGGPFPKMSQLLHQPAGVPYLRGFIAQAWESTAFNLTIETSVTLTAAERNRKICNYPA
jgi:hypothetical protein